MSVCMNATHQHLQVENTRLIEERDRYKAVLEKIAQLYQIGTAAKALSDEALHVSSDPGITKEKKGQQ
jgi:hypothetical protein